MMDLYGLGIGEPLSVTTEEKIDYIYRKMLEKEKKRRRRAEAIEIFFSIVVSLIMAIGLITIIVLLSRGGSV